jgi:hypothetical protein
MTRVLLFPVLLLLTPVPLAGAQVAARGIVVCADPRPFEAAVATRDLVVHGRVLAATDPAVIVVGQRHRVRVEVVDVLKGQVETPVLDVVVDNRQLVFQPGEEWLLALPGAGSLFLEACGVSAVPVRDGRAVGRIESMASDQVIPVDRLRPTR